jgi:hypothetical protein
VVVCGEWRVPSQWTVTVDSVEWSREWRVGVVGEWRVERRECGARRRRSARSRSPPSGDHTADSILVFYLRRLPKLSFVCLFVLLQFILQQTLTKLYFF